jgi:hypothetical protein
MQFIIIFLGKEDKLSKASAWYRAVYMPSENYKGRQHPTFAWLVLKYLIKIKEELFGGDKNERSELAKKQFESVQIRQLQALHENSLKFQQNSPARVSTQGVTQKKRFYCQKFSE